MMAQYFNDDTAKARGDDTMSATASNYVFQVKIDKNAKKSEPTVSAETLEAYKREVEKYLARGNDQRQN